VHAAGVRPGRDGLILADVALQQVQGVRFEAGQGLGSLLHFHRALAVELRILPVGIFMMLEVQNMMCQNANELICRTLSPLRSELLWVSWRQLCADDGGLGRIPVLALCRRCCSHRIGCCCAAALPCSRCALCRLVV